MFISELTTNWFVLIFLNVENSAKHFKMFTQSELYRKVKYLQKREARQALLDYAHLIMWRSDGCNSVLDAGCGSGDVTREWPILPSNFKRLVGVDISYKMLDYAKKTQIHPKLSFEYFDLNLELEKQALRSSEPFDHVFSFFCLMCI